MKLIITLIVGALTMRAGQVQGVLADWSCVEQMVKYGRAKILKENQGCSMAKNYSRAAYGVITDDKRYYRLDDAGRDWALKLLNGTTDKDALKVIVTGDIQGNTIHVKSMSEL